MGRGTRRTTRQMQEAPQGVVFVWVNNNLNYPRDLAKKLGRTDLEIVSPDWLERRRFVGRNLPGLVLDHAAELRGIQFNLWREALTRVRK